MVSYAPSSHGSCHFFLREGAIADRDRFPPRLSPLFLSRLPLPHPRPRPPSSSHGRSPRCNLLFYWRSFKHDRAAAASASATTAAAANAGGWLARCWLAGRRVGGWLMRSLRCFASTGCSSARRTTKTWEYIVCTLLGNPVNVYRCDSATLRRSLSYYSQSRPIILSPPILHPPDPSLSLSLSLCDRWFLS